MTFFNIFIYNNVPCYSTVIIPGNVWQQESFSDPSVSFYSGKLTKKINKSSLTEHSDKEISNIDDR